MTDEIHVTFTESREAFTLVIREFDLDGDFDSLEYNGVVYRWNGKEFAPEEGARDGQRTEANP